MRSLHSFHRIYVHMYEAAGPGASGPGISCGPLFRMSFSPVDFPASEPKKSETEQRTPPYYSNLIPAVFTFSSTRSAPARSVMASARSCG